MRFNHIPFLIGHVRLVSVGLANMLLSGGWGPYGNSGVGVRIPWSHVDFSHSTCFEAASQKIDTSGIMGWRIETLMSEVLNKPIGIE